MDRTISNPETRDKVSSDLKNVIREAENLLKNAAHATDGAYQEARRRLEAALGSARENVLTAEESLVARSREIARNTDEFVQSHAWQSVGIGALAGLVMGMLMGRK